MSCNTSSCRLSGPVAVRILLSAEEREVSPGPGPGPGPHRVGPTLTVGIPGIASIPGPRRRYKPDDVAPDDAEPGMPRRMGSTSANRPCPIPGTVDGSPLPLLAVPISASNDAGALLGGLASYSPSTLCRRA
jgi:hypothetical protein